MGANGIFVDHLSCSASPSRRAFGALGISVGHLIVLDGLVIVSRSCTWSSMTFDATFFCVGVAERAATSKSLSNLVVHFIVFGGPAGFCGTRVTPARSSRGWRIHRR